MVHSCIPAVWGLGKLDIFPLDVKRIILMKVREALNRKNTHNRLMVEAFMPLNVELKGLVVAIDVEGSPAIQ